MTKLLSASEYAATRKARGLPGGTHQAVGKAIKTGRLSKSVTKKGNRYRIDPELADEEWLGNTDPEQTRDPEPSTEPHQRELFGSPESPRPSEAGAIDAGEARMIRTSIAKSQAVKWRMTAQLARLKLEEAEGRLVDADEVRRRTAELARDMREAVLGAVAALQAPLAAETDPHAVGRLLRDALVVALESFLARVEDRRAAG